MQAKRPYIILDEHDNVATAILDLQAGERIRTERGEITLTQAIAYGHKFALQDIPQGNYIVKYGAQIGRATAAIAQGEHVHVHNVEDIVDEVRKK
jgi:membrane protein implicated in regulation of membrane protease activity